MKKFITITLLTIALLGIAAATYMLLPHRTVIFGAWTEGFFDAKTRTLHPDKMQAFEKLIHKNVSIAHYYRGWEALSDPILVKEFETIRSNGWEPMINVNPYYFNKCPATNLPLYRAIAQGKCDSFLHASAQNLKQIREPFFLLFAWEMNNKDLAWSIESSGSSPQDFINAWRHMHDVFKEDGVTNVVWVFTPNTFADGTKEYSDFYPGDAYVDWTGIDGYNWGTTHSWSAWSNFAGTFTRSYDMMTALAPTKPMMIAEVNSTDKGGDKASWYTDMLTRQIPFNFPQVKALVIFNENKTQVEQVDWSVDVNPEALKAFQ